MHFYGWKLALKVFGLSALGAAIFAAVCTAGGKSNEFIDLWFFLSLYSLFFGILFHSIIRAHKEGD